MASRIWTVDEATLAFYLYKFPTKPQTRGFSELAKLINRSPDAVKFKLDNFAFIDKGKGWNHCAQVDYEVYEKYRENLDQLKIDAEVLTEAIENSLAQGDIEIAKQIKNKEDRMAFIKVRGAQSDFRREVLRNYNNTCCVTSMTLSGMLEAAHILAFKDSDTNERYSLANGLCLDISVHKAYDNNLLGINGDGKVVISRRLLDATQDSNQREFFESLNGRKISLARFVQPNKEFLQKKFKEFLSSEHKLKK